MINVFKQYNGDSLYLAAFAVSAGLLVYSQRKQAGSTGKKTAAALVLAFVFVFNGAAYWIVGKITDTTTYYRFFWMLPVLFLTAYQLTEAVFSRQKKKAFLGIAAFIICVLFGANCFISRANLSRPKNIYGLAPDTITIADAIMEDWNGARRRDGEQSSAAFAADGDGEQSSAGFDTDGDGKQSSAAFDTDGGGELPSAAFDMYLEYQVRTYEPRICWGISRKAYLYQAEHGYDYKKYARQQHIIAAVNEGIRKDGSVLRRCLDKTGIDYLVIRTEFDMDDYLSEISVFPAAYSENYTLYRVERQGNA